MTSETNSCEDNMSIATQNDDLPSECDEISRKQFAFEENTNPYKTKTYLHRKFGFEITKVSFAIFSAVILIVIIGIIVAAVNIKKPDSLAQTSDQHFHLLRSLVLSNNESIWIFDVDSEKHHLIQNTKSPVIAFDTYIEKSVFWSENSTSTISSLGNRYLNVTHTNKWRPQAIAVDYVTEKIYLIDKPSGTLNVIDLNGTHQGVVISILVDPHDLALDPAEGLMFIVQRWRSIIRANMDGTSLLTIVQRPKISAITIDRKATKLYWANDLVSIDTSDYEGNNRQTVTPIPMAVLSLAIFENRLFWTRAIRSSDSGDYVCPCTNVLWSCTMFRKTCHNITSHRLGFDSPAIVRTSFDQQRHLVRNPCQVGNGGCQHLCLMTGARGKGHDCACSVGWKLNSDGKTCSKVTSLLLYAQESYVRGRIVREDDQEFRSFSDAIIPTRYYTESLTKKPLIHFDYDAASGNFFFSDDHSIFKINVLGSDDSQIKIFSVNEDHKIRDLAFDWAHNSIYYVKESQSASYNHSIGMFSVANPDEDKTRIQKIIMSSSYKKEHYIDCPFFLVIHPGHEYLFYSEYNGNSDNLERVGTNGRGVRLLNVLYDSMYNFLAVDLERSRLYWSTSADSRLIRSADFDGSEERQMSLPKNDGVQTPMFLGVMGDWLYLGNYTEIWRIRERGGENATATRIMGTRYGVGGTPEYIHGLGVYGLETRRSD